MKKEAPFQEEIGLFESFTLLCAALGTIEFGFTYTTVFVYVIMTVAFSEMVRLKSSAVKEMHIAIKTKWIEWYFFFAL
jgi:hypothetical protein